jgi:hypothetical protein
MDYITEENSMAEEEAEALYTFSQQELQKEKKKERQGRRREKKIEK